MSQAQRTPRKDPVVFGEDRQYETHGWMSVEQARKISVNPTGTGIKEKSKPFVFKTQSEGEEAKKSVADFLGWGVVSGAVFIIVSLLSGTFLHFHVVLLLAMLVCFRVAFYKSHQEIKRIESILSGLYEGNFELKRKMRFNQGYVTLIPLYGFASWVLSGVVASQEIKESVQKELKIAGALLHNDRIEIKDLNVPVPELKTVKQLRHGECGFVSFTGSSGVDLVVANTKSLKWHDYIPCKLNKTAYALGVPFNNNFKETALVVAYHGSGGLKTLPDLKEILEDVKCRAEKLCQDLGHYGEYRVILMDEKLDGLLSQLEVKRPGNSY